MSKAGEWIGDNCRFAREKRKYSCEVSIGSKTQMAGDTYAVSEQQAEAFFWHRFTNGNVLKQHMMKEKGYACRCREVLPEPGPPPKPVQQTLFPMGPDPFKR